MHNNQTALLRTDTAADTHHGLGSGSRRGELVGQVVAVTAQALQHGQAPELVRRLKQCDVPVQTGKLGSFRGIGVPVKDSSHCPDVQRDDGVHAVWERDARTVNAALQKPHTHTHTHTRTRTRMYRQAYKYLRLGSEPHMKRRGAEVGRGLKLQLAASKHVTTP